MNLDPILDAVKDLNAGGVSVRDWAIFGSESRAVSLGVKDREVGNVHAPINLTEGCGARYHLVWSDGRVSRGYVERRLLEDEPVVALRRARTAAYDDPDAAWVRGPAPMAEISLYDPGTASIARGETAVFGPRLDAIRRRVEASGVQTWSGSFSASDGESRLVTSAGLDVQGRGTSSSWHVTVDGELGDGHASRALESLAAFGARLDRLLETTALLKRPAVDRPGAVMPVILHPGVVEAYAVDTLLTNLTGATVAHGDGHFSREQFGSGEVVLRDDLTVRIDPTIPMRRGSYRFTGEGVPASPCAFIERGRLVQPVLDLKYARRLGLEPTPVPMARDTTFLEGPPEMTLNEALATADGGALVLSVLGVHTQDATSGDFSLSCPQVLEIADGQLGGRLRATISGNLFRLLTGDGLRLVRFEGEHTPGLLVSCRLDPK